MFVDLDRNEVWIPSSRPLPRLPDKPKSDLLESLKTIYKKGYGLHKVRLGADLNPAMDPALELLAFPEQCGDPHVMPIPKDVQAAVLTSNQAVGIPATAPLTTKHAPWLTDCQKYFAEYEITPDIAAGSISVKSMLSSRSGFSLTKDDRSMSESSEISAATLDPAALTARSHSLSNAATMSTLNTVGSLSHMDLRQGWRWKTSHEDGHKHSGAATSPSLPPGASMLTSPDPNVRPIRDAFFKFFVMIMRGYRRFLKYEVRERTIKGQPLSVTTPASSTPMSLPVPTPSVADGFTPGLPTTTAAAAASAGSMQLGTPSGAPTPLSTSDLVSVPSSTRSSLFGSLTSGLSQSSLLAGRLHLEVRFDADTFLAKVAAAQARDFYKTFFSGQIWQLFLQDCIPTQYATPGAFPILIQAIQIAYV